MPTPAAHACLFEPVRIGPVTAPNRFYQVPHCTGMGHRHPRAEAALRGMKAAGGWGVVCTQETEIHPSSDVSPACEGRIWDESDLPVLSRMVEAVHAHGALAGVQLAHNGHHARNLTTRTPPLAPAHRVLDIPHPGQARAMGRHDLRQLRRWHREAVQRAVRAGFDIIYVYAGHQMTLAHHFLLARFNDRGDDYGGSLENRARLTRELLEDAREAAGGCAAIAFRFAVDEVMGPDGMQAGAEGRELVEMLAHLPDLWDVNLADWSNDSQTSRFQPEDGFQMPYIDFVRQVVDVPVVGTGRLTSPDMMAGLVRRGVLDLIGAARPSIADPFLPDKIRQGRAAEIRECIGCNICVASDNLCVPIRCTQNPTMGEEWRYGWHPEQIAAKGEEEAALVVGAGPAGLECAMQLARRGYRVTLAEARAEPGGRVMGEGALPGLAAWRRVADYRLTDLRQRGNVESYTDSPLDAAQVVELGIPNVFMATGSRWRADGRGRSMPRGIPIANGARVLTPDDIIEGRMPPPGAPVLLFDDDQGYLGGVLAEKLARAGHRVIFVTPSAQVSPFTEHTLEQSRVQARLIELDVQIVTAQALAALDADHARLRCVHTGRETTRECTAALLVTERIPETTLYDALRLNDTGLRHLELMGDALVPGLIADAVHSGHRAARDFERSEGDITADLYRREMAAPG